MKKDIKGNNIKGYIYDLDTKIENLYDEESNNDEELKNLIDLIKLDNNSDYNPAFENQLSYLINSDKDKNYFDFKHENNITIQDFIFNYISESEAKISNISKKNKQKKRH